MLSRRALLLSPLAAAASIGATTARASAATTAGTTTAGLATAATVRATAVPPRTTVLGESVRGRPIRARRVGNPEAPLRALVVGCIHGNEDDGIGIARRLRDWAPPRGICLYTVATMNPDGNARVPGNDRALDLRGRNNANGVNLNRNFPGGRRTGTPGSVDYSGPRNLSEPESRTLHRFLRRVEPHVLVVYHQHMDVVDYCGGDREVQRRYAHDVGQRFTQLTRYPGSMATWYHRYAPRATVMTVELGITNPPDVLDAHEVAIKRMLRSLRDS